MRNGPAALFPDPDPDPDPESDPDPDPDPDINVRRCRPPALLWVCVVLKVRLVSRPDQSGSSHIFFTSPSHLLQTIVNGFGSDLFSCGVRSS